MNSNEVYIKTIGEIAYITSGKSFPKKDQGESTGEIPFYKVSDMNLESNRVTMTDSNNYVSTNYAKKIFPKGSIIFPKVGGAIATNKKRILSFDSLVDNNIMVLIPKGNYSDYLYYYFLGIDLMSLAVGTTLPALQKKIISDIKIYFPSIDKQKQIVSKIKECFTLLDKSEDKLKQAEEKLSLVINSSNKLFKTKTSNITYKLSEVFKLRNGKFNPSSNLKNNFDTEFKFKVYGGNGVTGYFNKALVQGQTIIIGRVGAKCGSIHKSKEPVWVTDNALYIETFLKEVDLEFLYWKLISLNLNGLSDGTGQPKIDQSKIYSLTIDIPDTIEEQKRIARQFEITNERVNNSLAQIQRSKSVIQNIRQSILKKAFEGKLI